MGRKNIQRNYDEEGNLISKECGKCNKTKPVSEFSKCKSKSDGYNSKCKECDKEYRKQYYKDNKEKISEYDKRRYEDNKEYIKEKHKQHYEDNKEYYKQYNKQYREDNKEYLKEKKKQYYEDNKENIKAKNKQYREDNKEYYKQYRKQYYEEHKENIITNQKQYYEEHKENIITNQKQYYKDNKEKRKEYNKQYYNCKTQEALENINAVVKANPGEYDSKDGGKVYGTIYLVHNIKSDRYYVGQTTNSFDIRYQSGWLYEHSKKELVKEDLDLYGEESFEYTKLFKVAHSQHELDKLEAYYIDYYESYENGYNETRGNIFTNRGKEKII